MGSQINRVLFIRSQTIDKLDYESGISDQDYKNKGRILPIDKKYLKTDALKLVGPVWRLDPGSAILKWGIPIVADHMPKSYFLKGPVRPIADFKLMWGSALVSQKFKDVVENLEPDVHQFFPTQLYWPRKKPVEEKFYFFNVCNHIDSVHEVLSEMPSREVIYSPRYEMDVTLSWKIQKGAGEVFKVIFDRNKIGNRHLWRDGYLNNGIACTDAFRNDCLDAGISGISFNGDGHEISE